MLIETFIRKQLRLKAHRVTQVETTEQSMIVYIFAPWQKAHAQTLVMLYNFAGEPDGSTPTRI